MLYHYHYYCNSARNTDLCYFFVYVLHVVTLNIRISTTTNIYPTFYSQTFGLPNPILFGTNLCQK